MARNNLAGLAALGALGMMMNKGKKGEDTSGMDAEMADRANAVSRGRTDLVDTGMSTPEPGGRVRPDENYGNEGRRTGPVGIGKVSRSRPVSANNVSDIDLTGGSMSPDQTGGQKPAVTTDTVRRLAYFSGVPLRGRRDEADNPYKKGGVVKMAKGGMTSSASSRGDGIAQRGKTKGTMVACGGGYMKGKK
jgi:hypothetical protein